MKLKEPSGRSLLTSLEPHVEADVDMGEVISACAVTAANVVKDIRENIRNLVGGRMAHYEKLIEDTTERALDKLSTKAREQGYDGVMAVRIAHPTVVEGGVEILVYGTAFKYRAKEEKSIDRAEN